MATILPEVFFHGVMAYTRATTVRVNDVYIQRPTPAMVAYVQMNADHLNRVALLYPQVVCICPGTIQIPEWGRTDGQIMVFLIRGALTPMARSRVVFISSSNPSCETVTDIRRFNEEAIAWCARNGKSYDFLSDQYGVSVACDRRRRSRVISGMMNQFGFHRAEQFMVLDDVAFPLGFMGRWKQVVFGGIEALDAAYPTLGIRGGRFVRRLRQIAADNLIYDAHY